MNLREISNKNDHNEGVFDYDGFYDAGTYGDRRDNSKRTIIGYDEEGNPIYSNESGRTEEQRKAYNDEIARQDKENGVMSPADRRKPKLPSAVIKAQNLEKQRKKEAMIKKMEAEALEAKKAAEAAE